jgi:hypothetical protein
MASIASSCRLSARAAARQVRNQASARSISSLTSGQWNASLQYSNRFPDFLRYLSSAQLHHACTITDNDRGEHCELEGQRGYAELCAIGVPQDSETDVSTGDSFAAGDVLLEVETDKAQMDVEAQDDGKMAKIMVCPIVMYNS